MKASAVLSLFMVGMSFAASIPSETSEGSLMNREDLDVGQAEYEIGPFDTEEELDSAVEDFHANNSTFNTIEDAAKKHHCVGVKLCARKNFRAPCYWACYPYAKAIYPSKYWVHRLSSATIAAHKGVCNFYNGNCRAKKAEYQSFSFPGTNFAKHISNNVHCFECWPHAAP